VNVRLISATNRDLTARIAEGLFREDLYFRLNVIRVKVPALRDRVADIPLLVDYFAQRYSEQHRVPRPDISPTAMEALLNYRWPGNVRELKNVIERVILRTTNGLVTPADLPADVFGAAPGSPVSIPAEPTRTVADELAARMIAGRESFWSAVYPTFMARDITRGDMRRIIEIGLDHTNGNYRSLVRLFNMREDDYKRFLGFLRKHNCHVPFRPFRTMNSQATSAAPRWS
jgi:DNA-binding NtrC family response regulator